MPSYDQSSSVDYSYYDQEFQDADIAVSGGGSGSVPYGKYQVQIEEFKHGETKNNDPKITCVMTVISGDYKGYKIFKNWNVCAQSMPYIKRDFAMIGFDPDKQRFSEIVKRLNTAKSRCFVVKKSENQKSESNPYVDFESRINVGSSQSQANAARPQQRPTNAPSRPAPPQQRQQPRRPAQPTVEYTDVGADVEGDDVPF